MLVITDMETWVLDESERIYRYQVYKRMFTPYEQKNAFVDESQFESDYYSFGKIEEAVELGNGEWLIGIRQIIDNDLSDSISFYRLGDIQLSVFDDDKNMLKINYEDDE